MPGGSREIIVKCGESPKRSTQKEGCCIKLLSPDYMLKLTATMASMTEGEVLIHVVVTLY
jgi:hypothetical protein